MLASKTLGTSSGPINPAWNVAYAEFLGTPNNAFSVNSQDSFTTGIFFKPDGLRMYVLGRGNDRVYEYLLSTAWEVSSSSFVQSFSVSAQESSPAGLFFRSDGLKMYVLGASGQDINEYNLSSAWNVSTAVYLQNFSVASQDTQPTGLFFKPDGLKMYVTGDANNRINEYNLSTAWDVSTASFLQFISISANNTSPKGLFFKPDGTVLYVTKSNGAIQKYDLSTAWNIATVSYATQTFSLEFSPTCVFFKDDGAQMYVLGTFYKVVYQYSVPTAWDLNSASYIYPTTKYKSITAQNNIPSDIYFRDDGLKFYATDSGAVFEYSLSTAWDIVTASYVQSFSVISQEDQVKTVFFKSDGTKMYICGTSGDDVNEYNLSVAWDISTAVFLQVFSVAAQDTLPTGLFFKSDGLKMYVLGQQNDRVLEYNLSTAWDVSTASYLQFISVSSQDTAADGLFFKPDGNKMYMCGINSRAIHEYQLSAAWDVTTASFARSFSVVSETTAPVGLSFRNTGLEMFVMSGNASNAVWAYDLV